MNSVSSQSSPVRLASTEDGIHLVGSILWLDSLRTGDLSFVSSPTAAEGRLNSTRVIATEQTLKILEALRKKSPNALVCQYNHPFAIGQLHLELLPSGAGLGGASLLISTRNRSVLYAPHVQPQKTEICRQMQLKPAQTLILSAKYPFPNESLPHRKKEWERLEESCRKDISQGLSPIILCEPSDIAQELTLRFSELGFEVTVHSSISKINKLYESYGSYLGQYNNFLAKEVEASPRIYLFPKSYSKWLRQKHPLLDGPIYSIDNSSHALSSPDLFLLPQKRFVIGSDCDARELKEVISQVKPDQLFIFGPYAKDYVKELRNSASQVETLFPNHLPALF